MATRSRWRRIGYAIIGLAGAYLLALFIAGYAARGLVADTARDRLAASLDGDAAVADVELGLIRGQATLRGLAVERHHWGTLRIAIERVDVELAPLGAVMFDRDLRHLAITGAHLLISGGGALSLPRRHARPIAVHALDLRDSSLEIVATAALPQLGRIRIILDHVRCGPTRFRTALSWLFSLESLDATVELPGDTRFALRYRDRRFTVVGGPFGDTPTALPIELPRVAAEDEPAQLRALALELGAELARRQLRRWWWRRLLGK